MQAHDARTAFLESLAPELRERAAADVELDEAIAEAWQTARAAWPAIDLEAARFFGFVGARAVDGQLRPLHAADLFLACACSDGNPEALAAFEKVQLERLRAVLARAGASRDTIDEVVQRVRVAVLVRHGAEPPDIEGYRGRSDLHSWLRVVGTREQARVEKRARREVLGDDAALWADIASSDPELAYIKEKYRHTAVLALKEALAGLPADDRTLLRQHLVDGLGIDEIAAHLAVHRATAARRLERARERVAAAMRAEIVRRLQIDTLEIDELLELVRSRLDVSVRRVLRAAP